MILGASVLVGWAGSAADAGDLAPGKTASQVPAAPTNCSAGTRHEPIGPGAGSRVGEPRYWAGDVSFVTPASYLEEQPVAETPVEAEPVTSQPAPAPQRFAAPEPVVATPDAAGSARAPGAIGSASSRPRRPIAVPMPPAVDPQFTNQTRQAIGFYGGRSARATLAQMPRRMTVQPSAASAAPNGQPLAPRARPFDSATARPTISPYLNLYRDEADSEVVPNYFAFVRPQLEQQEANQRQQQQLEQLERRFPSGMPTVVGPQYGGSAGRSTPARFMDTAQFYSGWQR
jgi:hypothetical protein